MFMTTINNQFLLMNKKTIAAGKFFVKTGLLLVTVLVMAVNQLPAQQKTISGTVTDAGDNNKALTNVSVVVKGTTRGTTTNSEGRFTIEAAENETIVFSIIGYEQQELKPGRQETLSVRLRSTDSQLESVVVTA